MATFSLPSLSSQQGYTVIERHKMDVGRFTDTNHLYNLLGQNVFIDHLGLVTPFNQYGLVNASLLSMLNQKKAIIYLDNLEGRFRFDQPYKRGLPYVVDTYYTNTIERPGFGGSAFILKLSEEYSNGDVLTTDLLNAPSLVVGPEQVTWENGGWLHTVRISSQNPKHTFYPKKYLKPTSQYLKIDHAMEEYGEQGSSITNQRLGWLELEANLGSGEKKVEHWITLHGAILAMSAQDKLKDKIKNYDLNRMDSILTFYNKDTKGKVIPGSLGWLPTIDGMVLSELFAMQDLAMQYGKGGEIEISGRKKVKLSLGLREQLRSGNRITYQRGRLNVDLLDASVANLYRGTGIPLEDRETTLDVGDGFMNEVAKLLELKAIAKTPGTIDSVALNMISGKDPMNLTGGYRFTSYRLPNAGLVHFRTNQALNNEYGLRNQDGLYGEFPQDSFSAMILDVTDSRATSSARKFKNNDIRNATDLNNDSNVYIVKPRAAADDYWGYIPGTVNPYGLSKTKGSLHASSRPGYGMFAYNFGNLWVRDPSRTLLIELEH